MLEITVHDIRGHYPVYKVGDIIIIQNPQINLEMTDALCSHALPSILHYALIKAGMTHNKPVAVKKPL